MGGGDESEVGIETMPERISKFLIWSASALAYDQPILVPMWSGDFVMPTIVFPLPFVAASSSRRSSVLSTLRLLPCRDGVSR